jgi:UDP-glucose 4-epimerase
VSKVLVTGGAGFIGSHIVDGLIARGYEVIVIDDESSTANEEFFYNEEATYVKQSICSPHTKTFYHGVEYVFHLAAHSRIQPALNNPIECVETNVLGTATVLQFAREAGVKKVINSSTSSSYGLKNKPPLKEDMIPDPLNPYSVSKISAEGICKMYTDLFGIQCITLRYFNVYGDRQPLRGTYAPVVGLFLEQKKLNQPLTIVGDGEQRRDFTHVKDVVKANLACIDSVIGGYQTINIGTSKNYSVNEIAAMISDNVEFIPERPGECRETLASNSKASYYLDWEPTIDIKDWINEYEV